MVILTTKLMKITTFKTLISNLPVRQQCFTTKRTTWEKAENQIEWLKEFNDDLFKGNKILKLVGKTYLKQLI